MGRSQLHQPIGKEEERNNFRFNPFLYLLTLINPFFLMNKVQANFFIAEVKRIEAITKQMPSDFVDYPELISIQNNLRHLIQTTTTKEETNV